MKTPHSANAAAKQFGRYIRARRLSLGLSRADLAHRLGLILGSHVSHVERGETRIADDAVTNWAKALEIDPGNLSEQLKMLAHAETLTIERVPAIGKAPHIALA
ncbi:MAG TPA: helix-turn-helix transcriptional regulator [Burkholderiales bacterium]|nr:helix-turn-helix transcriptional regulator [Burkholderiales bacterium]